MSDMSTRDLDEGRADELALRVEVLTQEVERLEREYARVKRAGYRRVATGMAFVGVATWVAGVWFPAQRSLLFALGIAGIFAAVFTMHLTPERFVAASTGERVFEAHSESIEDLIAVLGLSNRRVYVPLANGATERVRLFVPAYERYELPGDEDLTDSLVVPEHELGRGLSLRPSGDRLLRDLARPKNASIDHAIETIAESTAETFGLVDAVEPTVDESAGTATVGVRGGVYGPLDRIDHPAVSLLACGIAETVDRPVECAVVAGDDRWEYLITYTWETENPDHSPSSGA